MLVVLPTLVVGVLVTAAPAQAATAGVKPSLPVTVVQSDNNTLVWVRCTNSKADCAGWVSYQGITGASKGTKYSVKRGTSKYVVVAVSDEQRAGLEAYQGGNWDRHNGPIAQIRFAETSPANRDAVFNVPLVRAVEWTSLSGKVSGPGFGSKVTDVKVSRWDFGRLSTRRVQTVAVNMSNGEYSFGGYRLGANDSTTGGFRLSVSARVDGVKREWFWRGNEWGTGESLGGGKQIREGSIVRLNKDRPFRANFPFGQITGSVNKASEIRVAGTPTIPTTRTSDRRELDIAYCANEFGSAQTSGPGNYSVTFIPRADNGVDKRYMVQARPLDGNGMALWNNLFGTCQHTLNYTNAWQNLIAIPANGTAAQNFFIRAATGAVSGQVVYSGFTPVGADRYVTLREYIPGRPILESPIAAAGYVSSGIFEFKNVEPGRYWVETGRRTGCFGWYRSTYPNNSAYLGGADRGNERWKAFRKLSDLPLGLRQIAIDHGAGADQARAPGAGKAGWMYRGYCRSVGAGTYSGVWVGTQPSSENVYTAQTMKKGATITGKVTRTKAKKVKGVSAKESRSTKEMMVAVYNSSGKQVMRTALVNGSGYFKIEGLAPGTYRVGVNTDSWRGIGRTFKGTKTKTVKGSGRYSVGTLKYSDGVPKVKEKED